MKVFKCGEAKPVPVPLFSTNQLFDSKTPEGVYHRESRTKLNAICLGATQATRVVLFYHDGEVEGLDKGSWFYTKWIRDPDQKVCLEITHV